VGGAEAMEQDKYGLNWVCELLDCTPPAAGANGAGKGWGVGREAPGVPGRLRATSQRGVVGRDASTSGSSPPAFAVADSQARERGAPSRAVYPGVRRRALSALQGRSQWAAGFSRAPGGSPGSPG